MSLREKNQSGFALIFTIVLSALILVFIIITSVVILFSQKIGMSQITKEGQAKNIARAGIQDTIGWFKRQESQPVKQIGTTYPYPDAAFDPKFGTEPNPDLRDTDDENIGIVKDNITILDRNISAAQDIYKDNRNYQICGKYVIKKQKDPNNDGIISNDEYDKHAVHDITAERGKGPAGSGIVWYLEATGYVYQRRDFQKNSNGIYVKGPEDPPNRLLDKSAVSVEISRLSINLPANAAIITKGGGSVGNRCNIIGDSYTSTGIAYCGTTPSTSGAQIQISPTTLNISSMCNTPTSCACISIENIFGVSKSELKSLADSVYTNVNQIPSGNIPLSIVFIEGNADFTISKPLRGSGILIVDGNLSIAQNSNSFYSGLIYTTGSYTQGGSNVIGGAVISEGSISINPSSDKAIVEFNDSLIKNVRTKLGLYRENNLTYQVAE